MFKRVLFNLNIYWREFEDSDPEEVW